MKTEPATHAAQGHAAQHQPGSRSAALATLDGESFGQLLADLRADDDADTAQGARQPQDTENATDPAAGAEAWLGLAALPAMRAPLPAESTASTNDTAAVVDGQASDTQLQTPTPPGALLAAPDSAAVPHAQDALADEPQRLLPVGHSVHSAARSKQRAVPVGQAFAQEGIRTLPAADGADARAPAATWLERMAAPELAAPVSAAAVAQTPGSMLDALAAGARRDASRAPDAATPGEHASAALDLGGSSPGTSPSDPAEFGWQLGQALGEAFEMLGAQVSLWSAGKTHRASFSVDSGLEDPLAVDVAVTDGVAQLSFRTDDGALRQMIQSQASTTLADMLARVGLTLGGLDVGGQPADTQRNAPKDARARTTRVGLVDADTAAARDTERGSAMRFVRRDIGATGLDVYA